MEAGRPQVTEYTYTAPSGLLVTSCKPELGPDPWLRFGPLWYGLCSYRHIWTVRRKTLRKERAERRSSA